MPFAPKLHKQPNPARQREARERYDAKRSSAASRGYDATWRLTRIHHLQHNPLCAHCLHAQLFIPATEVHHIIKLAIRPDLRDTSSNLLSLCTSCHSKLTAAGM